MNQDLWRRAEDLFHAALARPAGERGAFVGGGGEDAELRATAGR